MRHAFKEWAVVVDALARGEQILILRKGGIREGRGGFKMEHDRFLLFPTLFHQQREAVSPDAQARFDQLAAGWPREGKARLTHYAEVVTWRCLESLEMARRLQDQHIWRDEVVRQRFDWGRQKQIYAIAVRVYRLSEAIDLPMRPEYGGCKSWIELDEEVSMAGATPVLDANAFEKMREAFEGALSHTPEPLDRVV